MALPARKQQRLSDIFDWFESVPSFLGRRSMEHLQGLRVEEYPDDGDYVVRAEVLPGVDPESRCATVPTRRRRWRSSIRRDARPSGRARASSRVPRTVRGNDDLLSSSS